jgi:ribonuclease P protein component
MNHRLSLSKPHTDLLSDCGTYPKSARVRYRREFLTIQRRGLRVHTHSFTVVAYRDKDSNHARMGCAVSKRVGNSVVRSRVRRLIRECFRRLQDRLSAVDFVVIAKPQAAQCAKIGLGAVAEELAPALIKASDRVVRKQKQSKQNA